MKSSSLLAAALAAAALCPVAHAAVPEIWTKNCAACHGPDGAGHTRAGRMAGVKDLTSAEYQAKFTDADAAKQIAGGLKDANGKVKMKAFAGVLSEAEIASIVAYVRTLKK